MMREPHPLQVSMERLRASLVTNQNSNFSFDFWTTSWTQIHGTMHRDLFDTITQILMRELIEDEREKDPRFSWMGRLRP